MKNTSEGSFASNSISTEAITSPQRIRSVTNISNNPTSGTDIIAPNNPPLSSKIISTSVIPERKKTIALAIFNVPNELPKVFSEDADRRKNRIGSMKYPIPNMEERILNAVSPTTPAPPNADRARNTPRIKEIIVSIPLSVSLFRLSKIPPRSASFLPFLLSSKNLNMYLLNNTIKSSQRKNFLEKC